MPDSQDCSMPLNGSFATPASVALDSIYAVMDTEQPETEAVRGAPGAPGPAKITPALNTLGMPKLPKRPTKAPQNSFEPVPEKPVDDVETDDDDVDYSCSDDDDSDDDADAVPAIPAAPAAPVRLLTITNPIGDSCRFGGSLKRLQFTPKDSGHLVGKTVILQLDPASPDAGLAEVRTWDFPVKVMMNKNNKNKIIKIYIEWEGMMSDLGVKVGDAVTLRQMEASGSRGIVFNVTIEKDGGIEELDPSNRDKGGRCKKRAATAAPAAEEGERQERPKVQKKTPAATKTPNKAQAPAREPSAPPTAPRTGAASASPAARLQNLNMCLEIMARRRVSLKSQASFQLAFLKADPAVAAQALRSLAIANQGASDNAHVHQTVELLMELLQ